MTTEEIMQQLRGVDAELKAEAKREADDRATAKARAARQAQRRKNQPRRKFLEKAFEGRDADLTRGEAERVLALYVRAGEDRVRANDTELLDLAEQMERKPNSIDMWIGQLYHLDTDGRHGLKPVTSTLVDAWADYTPDNLVKVHRDCHKEIHGVVSEGL